MLDSISADPKAGLEEKKAMMGMLRRFEDEQAEGGDGLGLGLADLEESDEEDELRGQLEGVDLGEFRIPLVQLSGHHNIVSRLTTLGIEEIDSNKLFALLPQKHRDAFIAALRDPESVEAKDLLDSAVKTEDGDGPPLPDVLPWWEHTEQLENDPETQTRYAPPPSPVDESLLAGITPPPGTGLRLVYNATAIW